MDTNEFWVDKNRVTGMRQVIMTGCGEVENIGD